MKATAVLAALEAASVPIHDVIQDAVLRDQALDAFETAKANEVQELQAGSGARIEAIKNEIESFLKEKNTEMEGLKQAKEAADRAFQALQARKRREEQRLFDLVVALPRRRRQSDQHRGPPFAAAPARQAVARPGMTPHVFRR